MVKFSKNHKFRIYASLDECLEIKDNKFYCKKCAHFIACDQRSYVKQVDIFKLIL